MYGKSPKHLEDPISNILYYISYKITQIININPNYITLLRLFIMFYIYYLLFNNKSKYFAAILFMICYFLDHLDGEMARQHDKITKFGDYFDHIVDNLYILPVITSDAFMI